MQKSWLSEAFIYHILIDRFYGSSMVEPEKPQFAGGTIQGIIDKIDYIKNLGVNTIWISPFYKGVAYHGYHITDFYSVDEHFGTINDLENLISIVHQNGMKIIADLVPNHCSVEHPFFIDAMAKPKSKYRNWFYLKEKSGDYLSFLGFKELAKINLDDSDARSYFINNAKFWMAKGLDGYRIDHVVGVSRSFLTELKSELKTINPDSILIGEAWIEGIRKTHYNTMRLKNTLWHKHFGISQEKVQQQYQGLLDGVLDFEARNLLLSKFVNGTFSEEAVKILLQKHYDRYSKQFSLVQFLDNHDTNRILFECGNDSKRVDRLFEILKKSNQPLVLYSGTEQGLTQSESLHSGKPYADLAVRQPIEWGQIK